MMRWLRFVVGMPVLFGTLPVWAQQSGVPGPDHNTVLDVLGLKFLSSSEFLLTVGVLIFGTLVIVIQFIVILKHKELFSSENILSIFTVPLIIVGTNSHFGDDRFEQ